MKALLTFLFCLGLNTTPAILHDDDVIVEDEQPVITETVEEQEEIATPVEEKKSLDLGEILQKYITPETVASAMSAITAIFTILKLLGIVKKEKTIRIKSADEITKELKKSLEGYEDLIYNNVVDKAIKPLVEKVNNISPTLDLFAKVLALSQTNTPESKIAILELLQKLGNTELIENQKQEIVKQVESEEATKQEAIELLNTIENQNNIEGRY